MAYALLKFPKPTSPRRRPRGILYRAPMTFTTAMLAARMAAPPKKVLLVSDGFFKTGDPSNYRGAASPKSLGRAYCRTSARIWSRSRVRKVPSLYMTLPRAIFITTSLPWAE